jgi:alkylation response protein AidB-like acyl-CoA dehydrogenase
MGYHGTPTCEINFENAIGYIIGQPHKGLQQMFTFMNNARIGSAFMGVNAAEKSYQNSLSYAKTRRAFR